MQVVRLLEVGSLLFGAISIINLLMEIEPPKLQRPRLDSDIQKKGVAIRTHIISAGFKQSLKQAAKEPETVSTRQESGGLFPSSISDLGDRMHKSVRVNKEVKNSRLTIANSQLFDKIQQIRNKCMKQRGSRVSILKGGATQSKEEDNESINQSEDIDDDAPAKGKAYLRKSMFLHRPSTIFFSYPNCVGIQNNLDEMIPIEGKDLKYRLTGQEYKCIINALQFNGFVRTDGPNWNVLFDINCTQLKANAEMNRYQKMNHFPGCWTLGRKDYMYKAILRMKRKHPEHFNFVPTTYIFPSDFDRFEIIREGADKDHLWIMKPSNAACGRGIKMITKDTKIKNKKDFLASEYIKNPHLINDLKYDLRIYVLVSSYDPLRIYMFDEGLTRFATHKYSTKVKEIKKRFIHLTNFSVNKHSKMFIKNKEAQEDGKGSKWSLTALRAYYESVGIDSTALFQKIKDVIIKTCISAEPTMLDIHSKSQEKRNCGFELYGFDILVDENLKPWLMEVNVCPSLSSSSPMDRKIKHMLLVDILNLIGLQYFQKKKFAQERKKQKEWMFVNRIEKKAFSKNINSLEELNYKSCVEILSPEDWLVLFETQQEESRRGHFQRIFPLKENIDYYLPLFEIQRYNNIMVSKWLSSERNFLDCVL